MKTNWEKIKTKIELMKTGNQKYIALLGESGNILRANTMMLKELELKNPRQNKSNFFNLLYPSHFENFKNALQCSVEKKDPYPVNLILRNGSDHPMKWQVSFLNRKENRLKTFICSGIPEVINLVKGIKFQMHFKLKKELTMICDKFL